VDQQEPKNPKLRTGNKAVYGCTYVETEENADEHKHYVRLKRLPDNVFIDEGFVEM